MKGVFLGMRWDGTGNMHHGRLLRPESNVGMC